MNSSFYSSVFFFSALLSTTTYTEHHSIEVKTYWGNQKDTKNFKETTWNNPRIGSSYNHQYHFDRYKAQDFRNYFTDHGYSEKEILNQRCLYMFDEFVKFTQTYSSYTCTIQQLHLELKKLNVIQKAYYYAQNNYCRGLQKRIHYLHSQLKNLTTSTSHKTTLYNNNAPPSLQESSVYQEPMVRDHIFNEFPINAVEHRALNYVYHTYTPSLSTAINKRTDAFNAMAKSDYALQYVSKSYNLNNNVKQLLNKYGHDTTRFTQCYGHQLHQALHQESLDMLNRIDHLSPNSVLYDHQEALIDFTIAMVDYNHENLTDKAMNIADFCWTLVDYGQAIAEGAALGAYTAVTDILNNPVEATICLAAGKHVLTYQLCKVLYNVADIGVTALSNADHAKDKWNKYTKPLNTMIDAIKKKEIAMRDVLKGGTAFVVGYKAQGRLLGGLGKFCNTIKQKSINFTKNSSLINPQDYFTTPEGLLFKATAQSNKLKPSEITTSKLKNSVDNKITKNKNIIPTQKTGSLIIEQGGKFSESEKRAAQYMSNLGNNVTLRVPKGTRADGCTSDLLVNGINYDVYTPITTNPDRIISAIAAKKDQATGIILDLSQTSVTIEQLGNIKARLLGKGINNITDIIILK